MRTGQEMLSEAGWRRGRSVDTTLMADALRADGYSVDGAVVTAIGELDGLVVEFERNDRRDKIVFSAAGASERWFPSLVASYSERVGVDLLPVGYTYHEHLLLMLASDGTWYGGHDAELWVLGDDVAETVERIVSGQGFREQP